MTEAGPFEVRSPLDIRPLTAIRIVAALWVVVGLYWEDLRGTVGTLAPALITHSQLGVELFFTLSGFILSHVYLSSVGERTFRYSGFLWARLARIYPLHLLTLAAVAFMGLMALLVHQKTAHSVLYWPALLPNILLVNAWGFTHDAGWNHPAWSISAEWFAYLLFPAFATAAWSLRSRPVVAAYIAATLVVVIYPLFRRLAGFELTDATIIWGALRILPCFIYGMAMSLLWRAGAIKTRSTATLMTLLSAVLSVVLVSISAPAAPIIASFGTLILSLASLTSTGSSLFSGRLVVYLGEVSFAVYMVAAPWKMLAGALAAKWLHMDDFPLPLWLAYLACVLPVAMLAHHLVERPARAWMRRWWALQTGTKAQPSFALRTA